MRSTNIAEETVEEKKLGEILVSNNLVTEEQLIDALSIQQQHTEMSIGQILVKQGLLSEKDLNTMLDYYGKRQKLGQILLQKKFINQEQLEYALGLSRERKETLAKVLIQLNFATEDQLAIALSAQYDMPFLQLKDHRFAVGLDKIINQNFAVKNRVAVVEMTGKTVTLAMAIPLGPFALTELESATGFKIRGAIAKDGDISHAHKQIYGVDLLAQRESRKISLSIEEYNDGEQRSKYVLEHNVGHILKKLLTVAVTASASDIHLENTEDGMRVRFRIDGVLQPLDLDAVGEELRTHGPSLVSKIKIQSDLDITERRRPQDGSFRVQVATRNSKRNVDFRVSIIPTRFGENVVIRVLDKVRPMLLHSLGFPSGELNELQQLLENPTGIYLVTGPTGSGKTSTLYAILNKVNAPGVKILTAEDPIEYSLGDISQCEVNETIGNTFAELLRSFLRQDPDCIMVGEMRDLETCSIAIRAALTGHTVLSTLHTNDATSAITRLIDMNVEPSLIATTLRGVIAQRLVRINCVHCREAHQPAEEFLDSLPAQLLDGVKHLRGKGCALCHYTGFSGRRPLIEMWSPTREESFAIGRRVDNSELRDLVFLQTGRKTMLENGLELVRDGETTLEELLRNVPAEQVSELGKKYGHSHTKGSLRRLV